MNFTISSESNLCSITEICQYKKLGLDRYIECPETCCKCATTTKDILIFFTYKMNLFFVHNNIDSFNQKKIRISIMEALVLFCVYTTLIPSSSAESVFHYSDLICDTYQTRLGWGIDEELSWDSGSSYNVLERWAWSGTCGLTKVSQHTSWRLRSKR